MFKVASWNLNSVRSRLTHVTTWLKDREPDVLLLQKLKGTEFPQILSGARIPMEYGYQSVQAGAAGGAGLRGNLKAASDAVQLILGVNNDFRSKLRRQEMKVLLPDKLKGADSKHFFPPKPGEYFGDFLRESPR